MSPNVGLFVTVKLNETATAEAGMPQMPVIVKLRVELPPSEGAPYCPVKPKPRVSAPRQGDTATKGRGAVAVLTASLPASRGLRAAGGVQKIGACQLAVCSPGGIWPG